MRADEEGGDAACWAHLMPDNQETTSPVSLSAILAATDGHGPIWSKRSADLDLNVIALTPEQGIAEHINAERDVLLVAVEGRGRITIDDRGHSFAAGQVVVVPKGSRRAIEAVGGRFAYLTCHLHRPPLMPVLGNRARE